MADDALTPAELRCSFCTAKQSEPRMLLNSMHSVWICVECVETAVGIITARFGDEFARAMCERAMTESRQYSLSSGQPLTAPSPE